MFFIAIWGAYLIRSMLLWVLGMITFWTTRVSAIYDTYFTAELLLSGRLVPLALLPAWARALAGVLPFKYTFGYPIEVLAGSLSTRELLRRARRSRRSGSGSGWCWWRWSGGSASGGSGRWGRELALRLAGTFLRIGILNELQYRVNFAFSLVQSVISVGTSLAVLALVFGKTDSLRGWSAGRAARRHGRVRAGRRTDQDDHPAEHAAADDRRAGGHARLRADQAGRRAAAGQRAAGAALAGRGRARRRAS